MKTRPSWSRRLPVIFGLILASFVGATVFTHWRLLAIDRASYDIADNAAPSIERLVVARGEMRRLQVLLRENLDRRAAGAPRDAEDVDESSRAMNRAISEYLRLPVFPGENAKWAEILRAKERFNEAVAVCQAEVKRGDFRTADRMLRDTIPKLAEDLSAAITRDVEFNVEHSEDLALQIRRLRSTSTFLAAVLGVLCVLGTFAGALALHRAMRAHIDLAERHQRMLEERASELEQFAGRIAHDIVSPLGAVGFALQLAGGPGDEDARARHVARGMKGLHSVQRLVHGLLEFARAGARPERETRTDVAATIADLVGELGSAATEVGAELVVSADVACEVCCNAGVLTSLVANLARNAIKYIGDGPVRRIEIRAAERDRCVRVEVEDTGPGLLPELEERAFEPYVRGPQTTQSGIGLGLATVKRLAESHGGTVGVHSVVGKGCTFWFELPTASREERASAAVPRASAA